MVISNENTMLREEYEKKGLASSKESALGNCNGNCGSGSCDASNCNCNCKCVPGGTVIDAYSEK